jgi:transaldolase
MPARGGMLDDLRMKIFAYGADERGIAELARHPRLAGFTTNPTLRRAMAREGLAELRFAFDHDGSTAVVPDPS